MIPLSQWKHPQPHQHPTSPVPPQSIQLHAVYARPMLQPPPQSCPLATSDNFSSNACLVQIPHHVVYQCLHLATPGVYPSPLYQPHTPLPFRQTLSVYFNDARQYSSGGTNPLEIGCFNDKCWKCPPVSRVS